MNSLEKLSGAKRALMEAKSLDDVARIRDIAVAAETYARAAKLGLEAQNEAAEVARRAERKAGDILAQMPKNEGRLFRGSTMEPRSDTETLADIGIDKKDSHRWQKVASVPDDTFEGYIAECKEQGEEITRAGLLRLAEKPHVSQNTGNNEWYTPPAFIDAARICMGHIDVDPASSAIANEIVCAKTFYTIEDDGRTKEWRGNVWMNPPYAQPFISQFTDIVTSKYENGEIEQACVLVNNATETAWFQRMLAGCSALCLVKGRIKYLNSNMEIEHSPLQGQVVVYFGKNIGSFGTAFQSLGRIAYV